MSGAPDDGAPLTLGGRYRLQSLIAEGGMAAVWLGRDEALARTVAIKVLHDHLSTDAEFVERFRREAIAAAKLTHPHVVSIYDTGHEGRRVWLVMELVEGATLRRAMDDRGPLEIAQAADIGAKTARGLAFAHEHGLVHRDVKPANILLGRDGTVKVTDFGIAKSMEAGSDLTGTGTVLGTAAYVAPEQIRSEPLDGACDQYSLGCVLYEALTGRRPFNGDTPMATAAQRLTTDPPPVRSLRADVPAGLAAAVGRALARDAADRFPTAAELADALEPFAPRPDAAEPAPRRAPRAAKRLPALPRAAPGASAASGGPAHTARLRPSSPPLPGDRIPTSTPGDQTHPNDRWQGRWVTASLAAVGVAVAVFLGAFASGMLGRDGTAESPSPDSPGGLVAPVAVELFDPGGTGSEDGAGLPSVLDGDPSTSWRSVGYNTPDFGGLKPGLGFWLDLGAPHTVAGVALRTGTPGISYEIRLADAPSSRLDGWRLVGAQQDAAGLSEVVLDEPAISRYVLVWITGDLQPDGSGRHRVQVTELAVRAAPA